MLDAIAQTLEPRLTMHASPALVAFAELLTLSSTELAEEIDRQLDENPALERIVEPGCAICAGPEPCACLPTARARPSSSGDGLGATPVRSSVRDDLVRDAAASLPPGERPLVEYVVGSLDARGFLDRAPEELAAALGVRPERVVRAVAALREVGAPFLAAVDLRECLLLQLDHFGDEPLPALARQLVSGHLEALAVGRFGAAAQALDVRVEDVRAALAFIRHHLRPSAGLDEGEPAVPLVPDVVVRERAAEAGSYEVTLVEERRLAVRLAPAYAESVTPETARAREFLARLGERRRVMRRVAEEVVERQRLFLREGPSALRPLTRAHVAAAVGVHESTVSRATAGRHVLLPSGRVVPFATFFDAAVAPREIVKRLIADEQRPLSDSELADDLARRGHRVARRTVAKYRAELGIAASLQRA